jgi:hypothetical protein
MQDTQAYLEKLHKDAIDCALVSKQAIDPRKRELFGRLADHLAILASQVEFTIASSQLSVPKPLTQPPREA